MLRFRMAFIAGFILVCVFPRPSFADGLPVLSIDPVSSTVTANANLTLDVNISDVTNLYGFQFDLAFSPGTLSASSIAEGNFLSDSGTTFFISGTIDNSLGLI